MYDSNDKANDKETSKTVDIWNATSYNETRVLTVQVNLKCNNVSRDYEPGELKIKVDNLGKLYPTSDSSSSAVQVTSISADPESDNSQSYDWSYTYDSSHQKYILKNNKRIEKDNNFEGTIQLAYNFQASYLLNNSNLEINAVLNDVLESKNKLKVEFTSTTREGSISKSANKINSYDGFPGNAEDYIWVKYSFYASTYNSGVRGRVYDNYFEEELPSDDCILLNENLERIEKDEDGDNYKLPFSTSTSSSNYSSTTYTYYYYIGYPKTIYEDQEIDSKTKWYGKYYESYYYRGEDKEKLELLAEDNEKLNLSDFKFSFSGDLYSVYKSYSSGYSTQSYNKIINENYGENIDYYMRASSIYTGRKYTARIGDDFLCITGADGNYRKLNENEYYFKSISFNSSYFYNANGIRLEENKYNINVFVKYQNEKNYVKYGDTLKNDYSSKTITFNDNEKNEKVVGWYLEICDLEESFKMVDIHGSGSYVYTTVHIQTKDNLKEMGSIYNFDYFQVYINDELDNPTEEAQYGTLAKEVGLPQHDQDTYGSCILRDYTSTSYGADKVDIGVYNSFENARQDNEYFYRDAKVRFEFESSGTGTSAFNGYRLYNLFPAGMEINCTEEEIIENLTVSYYSQIKKQGGLNFATSEEYKKFIKEHTKVNIDNNYKDTGRVCVEIIVNYENDPLDIYSIANSYCYVDYFKIPVKISYESYFTNGKTYSLKSYVTFLKEDELYLPYRKYTDSSDIDNDERTDDFYLDSYSASTSIVPAVSSYQEVNKSVWTENSENQWSSENATVKYNGIYKYKLRVRTGINNITNLVIYDNLETNGEWQGKFEGVDTTFTEGQGYTPKVWYSTSSSPGLLKEHPEAWLEYSDEVDKTTVKSLAFDYGENIVRSGDLTYVIINMRAPENVNTSKLCANKCYTKWNAIDTEGQIIDEVTGIDSNVATVGTIASKQDLKIHKIWEDNENSLGVRPEQITINLYRNKELYQTVTLNDSNKIDGKNWEYTFKDLPVCDENSKKYTYTINEDKVNLYSTIIENTDVETDKGMDKSFTITNTLNEDEVYLDIKGEKIWEDDNDFNGRRLESIKVNLIQDDKKIAEFVTNEEKSWKYEFLNCPIWKNNTEKYNYRVEEEESKPWLNTTYEESEPNAIQIKFNSQCKTESVSCDYVEIYYKKNDVTYKLGKWGGTDLANKTVVVPSKDFYLYWHTDGSVHDYYGFSIDDISLVFKDETTTSSTANLPNYNIEELTGKQYPESEHIYADNVNKLWHYSSSDANLLKVDITNTYIKIPTKVTVHHYKEGTKESISPDQTIEGLAWDPYETHPAEDIPPFYELVEMPKNAKGEMEKDEIVVTYYYKVREYKYRIEYYYDWQLDDEKTIEREETYNNLITSYPNQNKRGYRLATTEEGNANNVPNLNRGVVGLPLRISMNEDENIIRVYYVKNQYQYKIKYFYNGVLYNANTETHTATYMDLIEKYPEKPRDGFEFDRVEYCPLRITEREDLNVINVYYVSLKTKVIVHHYEEGTKNKLSDDVFIQGKTGNPYETHPAEDIPEKYELVETPKNATGEMKDKVIEVTYYYRLKNGIVIVKHLEKGTNEELADQERIEGKIDSNYTTKPQEIENYKYVEDSGNTKGTIKLEPTEVIYYYLQKTKVIVRHIDKTTNEVMLTEEEEGLVGDPYTSSSKDFKDYILVDKPEKETVKMEKDVITLDYYYEKIPVGVIEKHIDIKTDEILYNTSYRGVEGDPYTTKEKEFDGYDLVKEKYPDNSEGYMIDGIIEVKYYYIKKASVRVEYVDKNTGEKIPEEVIDEETGKKEEKDSTEHIYGHEGDPYETKEKEFDEYDLVEVPDNATGEMGVTRREDGSLDTETVVTYYYAKKSAGVRERHIDIKTGELLEEETVYTGHEGDPYETKEKEFDGYDLVKEKYPTNSKGTMKVEEIVVEYYYIRKAEVIVEYIDKNTGEKIPEEVIDEETGEKEEKDSTEYLYGHEGDEYSTKEKAFENYKLVEEDYPENARGEMEITEKADGTIETTTYVRYYYVKKSAGVIEKHIDIATDELLEEETVYEGYVGDPYETKEKEFDGYKLVKEKYPTNSKGEMTEEVIEVKYYYAKKTTVRVQHLEEGTNKKLAEDEIIEGYVGDEYSTNSKNIEDYYLLTDKIPSNKNGKMEEEEILVTYYYQKNKVEVPSETPTPTTPQPVTTIPTQTTTTTTTIPSAQTTTPKENNKTTTQAKSEDRVEKEPDIAPYTGDNIPATVSIIILVVIILNIAQEVIVKIKNKKKVIK